MARRLHARSSSPAGPSARRPCCGAGPPYRLLLSTTLPELAIGLPSAYLGHPQADTRVTHLVLAKGEAHTEEHSPSHDALPVISARERCLYHHLQRLQARVTELEQAVAHIRT